MSSLRPAALAFAALVPALAAAAVTIRVPLDAPSIQRAIDAAATGDTVLVEPGTYRENLDFKGKAITVTSAGGADVTIVDGGAAGSVAIITGGGTLRGFTLRNGLGRFGGGGVAVGSGSPLIEGNVITANQGCDGIGMALDFTSAIVRGNVIRDNVLATCFGGTEGGGISIGGAGAAQVLGNLIMGNGGMNSGGGIGLFAAGAPVIRGNLILGNSAASEGGGISMVNQSNAEISNNVIAGNSANQGGGVAWLVPSGSRGPLLVNNTIAGNLAALGSGVYADGFDRLSQVVNNVIVAAAGQTAVHCGGFNDVNPPVLTANDVWSPSGSAYGGLCADPTGTAGNLSADPRFVDEGTLDFRLQAGSPAIDAGAASAPLHPTLDLGGDPRVLDGDGSGTAEVDLGAYEASASPALTLSTRSLSFGPQLFGTASAPQEVLFANTGTAAVPVYLVSASTEFSQTSDCGRSLAAGASCTVSVRFSPRGLGARPGTLAIAAADGVLLVTLAGTGTEPPIVVTPAAPVTPPMGAVVLSASGGSGAGFTWSLQRSPSGGTIDAGTGAYRAGPIGGVSDVVRVVDSIGGAAEVSVAVSEGVSITPPSPAVMPLGTVVLTAQGGSGGGYRWSLTAAPSGGSIDAAGLYVAGPVGGVLDVVQVIDDLGNTASASVLVAGALDVYPATPSVPPLGSISFAANGGSGTGFRWTLADAPSGGSIDAATGLYTAGPRGGVVDRVQVVDSLSAVATTSVLVSAALAVTPQGVVLQRGGTQAFTASGGSGFSLVWTLATNRSGATIDATGIYTAGAVDGVTDVVQVTDSLGAVASAVVAVAGPLVVTPADVTVGPGGTQGFSASGGSGQGFTWSLARRPSGGTIDAATGAYRAGSTGGVTDVVLVIDSIGTTAVATVTVSGAGGGCGGCGQGGASTSSLAMLTALALWWRVRRRGRTP